MKLVIQNKKARGDARLARQETGRMPVLRHCAAFTLMETLAALLFLAIVIPAAVEAMHVASLAGEVAARKGEAARIADRVLNESLVMTNLSSGQSGTAEEGSDEFHWTLDSQNWPQNNNMKALTAQVTFSAQGRQYSVQMTTLADQQTETTPMGATGTGTTGTTP